MPTQNKKLLLKGNAAIAEGNHEGFLDLCTDDTEWTFVGEQTLRGKEAVRRWMAETYIEPPTVIVDHLISEGDFLTAVGRVTMMDKDGKANQYAYCDVWRLHEGKFAELQAFVIEQATNR